MTKSEWWFCPEEGNNELWHSHEPDIPAILSAHTARIVEVLEGMVAPLEGAANLQANISWNAALDEAITKIKEI